MPDGYRGVQQQTCPAGTYYLNPYVESITPVEVRSHRVRLRDIEFPSRDGFIMKPQVVVEYAAQPDAAPLLTVRLTDEGVLHQQDETPEEQLDNEILQKVILPHIRGYARIEGSNFDARDFILAAAVAAPSPGPVEKTLNAREALQKALLEKVKPQCAALGVEVRAVTLADMRPPAELSEQIAQRELARVEQAKNGARIRQYRAAQELKAKEALKDQAKAKVEAETRLIQAKTKATQMKEVALSQATQELEKRAALSGCRCKAGGSDAYQGKSGSGSDWSSKRGQGRWFAQSRARVCRCAVVRSVQPDEQTRSRFDRDFCFR